MSVDEDDIIMSVPDEVVSSSGRIVVCTANGRVQTSLQPVFVCRSFPLSVVKRSQLVVLLVSLYTTRRWMLAKNGSRIVCLPSYLYGRGLTVKTVTDIV